MPRNEEETRPSKRPRTDSGKGSSQKKTSRKGGIRTARKRIFRQLSSESSQSQNRETPTFYQQSRPPPRNNLQSPRTAPSHRAQDTTPELEDNGTKESSPGEDQYKDIGKMYALKIWPWFSSSWLVTCEAPDSGSSDEAQKAAFLRFLSIDVGLSSTEWTTAKFRQDVSFPYIITSEL